MTSPDTSNRSTARENLLGLATSAGIDQGLFGLRPGQNFWLDLQPDADPRASFRYEFAYRGAQFIAVVYDDGDDELRLHVICNPSASGRAMLGSYPPDLRDGDASTCGTLVRRISPYLKFDYPVCDEDFHAKRHYLPWLSSFQVAPLEIETLEHVEQ